ncbi:alpha/beta hydrolase [Rhizobium rhizogenes]|uniref:alpha/beta hydrolase n=1 Tax=Rhizobium rhizogenes TaxID=359 RepID=UPI00115E41E9|nr:alpha/beta hydrolase-fold protein [Rhizobium rhizogenes]NTF65099.1 alpha/beta hydrolase [Rhizobium rhizogenes]NTG04102.1 alpha/beta hydrolase [Rhizobium rhizogenes]NTG11204.1 alpha/beta hydrolase [Rhizobium rhizogenes]NTG96447.1 alpha/beta hydrolase [Rhizobium rhizogenes]TRB24892.1 alpha/beta hydrolase [Rhizobium rhizogenes]
MRDKAMGKTLPSSQMRSNMPQDIAGMSPQQPLVMPGCGRFTLRSSETGLDYEIFVYVPEAEPPASGFPVIYVLDANSDFITVAETVRRVSRRSKATGIAPSIVVGIGYPNTNGYNIDRRHLDFTRGPADTSVFPDKAGDGCGGQAAYIRFLGNQLLPYIQSWLGSDPDSRILLGHSLAGYFVLDLLAQHPDMFSGYVSFSPSVWWDRPGLSRALAAVCPITRPIRLYTAVGRWEQELAPWQARESFSNQYHRIRKVRRMIDNAREISCEVGASYGEKATVQFELGDDEDHATIVTALLCRSLRFMGAGFSA